MPEAEEPKHKRYKALFDSYDPDKIAQMLPDEYGSQQVPVSGFDGIYVCNTKSKSMQRTASSKKIL